MNLLRKSLVVVVFLSLLYLSVILLRTYNSQENIEKRCMLKFKKDFKNHSGTSSEEWDQSLDLADNNYLECIGMDQY